MARFLLPLKLTSIEHTGKCSLVGQNNSHYGRCGSVMDFILFVV
jgi:hypothetical protein